MVQTSSNFFRRMLDQICWSMYKKKFNDAENSVLYLIENIMENASKSKAIKKYQETYQTVYQSFNAYYLNWLKKRKLNIEKEKKSLNTIDHNHENYLIAKSSYLAEMDDLLFELGDYLTTLTKQQKYEVLYQLKCYRRFLTRTAKTIH